MPNVHSDSEIDENAILEKAAAMDELKSVLNDTTNTNKFQVPTSENS